MTQSIILISSVGVIHTNNTEMNAVEKFREENRQYRTIAIRVLNSMEGFQSASQLEKATMGA